MHKKGDVNMNQNPFEENLQKPLEKYGRDIVKAVKEIPTKMSIEEDEYKNTDGLVTNIKA